MNRLDTSGTANGSANSCEDLQDPLTHELEGALLEAPDTEAFIKIHSHVELNLAKYLKCQLEEKGLQRKEVIRAARLNETYGWQIFSDQSKRPGRDKLLAIAFAMHLDVDETRRLLRHGRVSELYAKNKRDAVIMVHLNNKASLDEVDRALYEEKLPTIAD